MATKKKVAKKVAKKTTKKVTKRVVSKPIAAQTNKIESRKKQVPVGVKIIAVLNYIGAILLAIMGIFFIFASGAIRDSLNTLEGIETMSSGLFIILGIILIAFAILGFFVGRGLWRGEQWARIVEIIFAILAIISSISNLVQGFDVATNIIELIIYLIIGGYLLFSKEVIKAFS